MSESRKWRHSAFRYDWSALLPSQPKWQLPPQDRRPTPAIGAPPRRGSFSTSPPEEARVEEVSWGGQGSWFAGVEDLWQRCSISSGRPVNFAHKQFVSVAPQKSAMPAPSSRRVDTATTPLRSFRALGTPALMAGSVATGWMLMSPLNCQMLLIYYMRDIDEVHQELKTGFCIVKGDSPLDLFKCILICRCKKKAQVII